MIQFQKIHTVTCSPTLFTGNKWPVRIVLHPWKDTWKPLSCLVSYSYSHLLQNSSKLCQAIDLMIIIRKPTTTTQKKNQPNKPITLFLSDVATDSSPSQCTSLSSWVRLLIAPPVWKIPFISEPLHSTIPLLFTYVPLGSWMPVRYSLTLWLSSAPSYKSSLSLSYPSVMLKSDYSDSFHWLSCHGMRVCIRPAYHRV